MILSHHFFKNSFDVPSISAVCHTKSMQFWWTLDLIDKFSRFFFLSWFDLYSWREAMKSNCSKICFSSTKRAFDTIGDEFSIYKYQKWILHQNLHRKHGRWVDFWRFNLCDFFAARCCSYLVEQHFLIKYSDSTSFLTSRSRPEHA